MSTVESTDEIMPKSVLRHRPIGDSKPPTGKRSIVTAVLPNVPRSSRLRPPTEAKDSVEGETHEQPVEKVSGEELEKGSAKRRATKVLPETPLPAFNRKPKDLSFASKQVQHPLLYFGIGMLGMLMLGSIGSLFYGWFVSWHDDLQYGRPRTFQIDSWVGHNEQAGTPSHFIALNLKGHIEIIELPGGDASHARIYSGPQLYGPNNDLTPVTLRFADVNNDHKPDMLVFFRDSRLIYLNDQGSFRPLQPSEHFIVERFWSRLQL